MKTVIVFRRNLLPLSETFIREQIVAMRRWSPVLAGCRRVNGGLDLAGLDVRLLPGTRLGRLHYKWIRRQQRLGKPHWPTVKALQRLEADLVHAHFGTDAADIWPSVKAAGVPMLVTLHGYDINIRRECWEADRRGWRNTYPRRLLHMARDPDVHFIAVSRAIKARAVEYGVPEDKVTVAYIGVDTERFRLGGLPIEQRPRRILFVGRMVEVKAPLVLIRTFVEIRKAVPDAELTMVGGGHLLADAKALAAELGLPVEFLGACRSGQVLAQMHRASVLCLPSITTPEGRKEGLGMVLLEAQACGVPVVTSALGGTIEALVDGKTGYALPPGDVSALAGRIIEILTNPQQRAAMSRAGVRFTRETFDISVHTRRLEDLYARAATRTLAKPGKRDDRVTESCPRHQPVRETQPHGSC